MQEERTRAHPPHHQHQQPWPCCQQLRRLQVLQLHHQQLQQQLQRLQPRRQLQRTLLLVLLLLLQAL